jgi:hypothetical protein
MPWYIIHPDSKLISFTSFVELLILSYLFFQVPLSFAFSYQRNPEIERIIYIVLDIIECLITLLNFFVAIDNGDGTYAFSLKKRLKRYFRYPTLQSNYSNN